MSDGNSESSCSSNSLPTNSGAKSLRSTQVILARTPDLIMERASARVGVPHIGKIGCNPEFSSCFSRYARMFGQEEIAKSSVFDARLNGILAFLFHDALVVCI